MSAERDNLLDRRRLKRKLNMWQGGAMVLLAVLIVVGLGNIMSSDQPHIARVSLSGMIMEDFDREAMLAGLAENKNAKAVIVRINSPGGTVAGSEAVFNSLMAISENKPTASFIATIGASGGYIAALGTNRIYARKNALTGSIGVIFQSPEFSVLLDKIGVSVQEVKSSVLKGGASLYRPMNEGQRAVIEQMIGDSNAWFVDVVSERRGMERELAVTLADGRVYTGGRAKENNLIDEVGSEKHAINWLKEQEGVSEDLPVIDYEPTTYDGIFGDVMSWAGFEEFVESRLGLDGLLALWQPM